MEAEKWRLVEEEDKKKVDRVLEATLGQGSGREYYPFGDTEAPQIIGSKYKEII